MQEQLTLAGAIMRAAGVTEVRVNDEDLSALFQERDYVTIAYRDYRRDQWVLRVRPKLDVVDAEEVPMPTASIEGGRA